jgi:DNA-binding XRE family transcriptional regulator
MESIRTARKQRDMTLAEVAEKTGLSISFLSDLERGRTDPSLSTLRRIAACYGMPVAYLLEEEGITMDTVRVPVPKFFVSPSILFLCVFCGCANIERQSGEHHRATGSHCDSCGAFYDIEWRTPAEQSVIQMTRADMQDV